MTFQKTPLPKILPQTVPPNFADNNAGWLTERAAEFLDFNETGYVLIHADDGVLWGRIEGKQLITPPESDWTPKLRSVTIQQCRVFGEKGELFVWRESEGAWKGRLLIEDNSTYRPKEKKAILYGSQTTGQSAPPGFTPLIETGVGMRQIIPIQVPEEAWKPEKASKNDERKFKSNWRAMLTVVEYLTEDDEGQVIIACSRLKAIEAAPV